MSARCMPAQAHTEELGYRVPQTQTSVCPLRCCMLLTSSSVPYVWSTLTIVHSSIISLAVAETLEGNVGLHNLSPHLVTVDVED